MSNRRRPRAPSLAETLAPLDGAQIPGGCDDCDAYQVIVANAYGLSGVSAIQIHHDDWCPTLARHQARQVRSGQ